MSLVSLPSDCLPVMLSHDDTDAAREEENEEERKTRGWGEKSKTHLAG